MSEEVHKPARPYIPETLYALIVVITTERICLRYQSELLSVPRWIIVSAAIGLVLLAALSWRYHQHLVTLLLVSGIASLSAAYLLVASVADFSSALAAKAPSAWTFEITRDSTKGTYGYRCRARARSEGSPDGEVWLTSDMPFENGETVHLIGRTKFFEDDDYGRRSRAQGVAATVRCVNVTDRERPHGLRGLVFGFRKRVVSAFEKSDTPERSLVIGSVAGIEIPLERNGLDELFAACGVSHLVAVSGGHLVVVAGVIAALLEGARLSKVHKMVIGLIASGLFVLFCGAPVSALRAWCMSAIALMGEILGRRSHSLSSVSFVALCFALVDSGVTAQLGYLLSVSAVVGLCLFSSYSLYLLDRLVPRIGYIRRFSPRFNRSLRWIESEVRATLASTLTAQAVTVPICLETFGTLSLIAPVANILITLPFTVLIALGMLAACFVPFPALSSLALRGADGAAGFAVWVLDGLKRVPYASLEIQGVGVWIELVALAAFILLIVLWPTMHAHVWRRVVPALCLIVLAVMIRYRWFAPARLVVLDVGQGDAILVQEGPSAILIDAGPQESLLAPLERLHVEHLDAVILTHLHEDHTGGLAELKGSIGVDQVYVANGVKNHMSRQLQETVQAVSGREAQELTTGANLTEQHFHLKMVWPKQPVAGDENGDSIELLLEYQNGAAHYRGLLTGDAEEEQLAQIEQQVGDIDVLKVGHHGSEVSINKEEAHRLSPELALDSAGEGNKYGHPAQECVDTLESAGAKFLCTKDVGSITVKANKDSIAVYTER